MIGTPSLRILPWHSRLGAWFLYVCLTLGRCIDIGDAYPVGVLT
jgi:hypothetical protein